MAKKAGRNEIQYEAANGKQPYVVYWVEGKSQTFRAAFGSEAAAVAWIAKFGDRPVSVK